MENSVGEKKILARVQWRRQRAYGVEVSWSQTRSIGDAENAGVDNAAPSSRGGKRAGRRVEGIQGH